MKRSTGRRLLALLAFLVGALGFATSSYGHALQPGYLELRLLDKELYAAVWKTPANKSRPMKISAVLPESCEARTPAESIWDGTAYVARWTTRCTGGLEGGVIRIDGLDQTRTDVLVRFDFANGVNESRRLTPGDSSFTVPTIPSRLEVVRTYLVLGFQHILSGIDHLMFVLALLLLVKGVARLIVTVTAFTLAHSLTLAGATLGFVNMPGPPIEATIALSIMFVASEIMHSRQGRTGLTERYPWVVAFTFGLLHGFGFAGALAQIGLPQASIPIALLFFNVGVEIGQVFFIASVFAVMALARKIARRIDVARPTWARAVPPYVIGSVSAFWVIQRLAAF
ncbi:MAG: HupE/UreJ family protein [Gammaproteobacteria bacterium]|nr:MAG: HupE/UreJ family protein [Gammaproteobacteria bacterium]